jgi:hypothetical protein
MTALRVGPWSRPPFVGSLGPAIDAALVTINGDLSITDSNDSLVADASVAVVASSTVTDAADTLSATPA